MKFFYRACRPTRHLSRLRSNYEVVFGGNMREIAHQLE